MSLPTFQDSKASEGSVEQWAAFGSEGTPTNEGTDAWASFQEPTVPVSGAVDDDEFGDFGDASSPAPPSQDLVRESQTLATKKP